MLISAKSVKYNSASSHLTLEFEETDLHGNIDGGHTYEIIKQNQKMLNAKEQYVKLEIVTGTEDFFQDLARARNTSTQVKYKSIAELENKFSIIKNGLTEDVIKNISFKENEYGHIDIVDLLATLNLFDLEKFPNNQFASFPVVSYSGKANCIKYYLKYYDVKGETLENPYMQMQSIIIDILKLYDYIEKNIDIYYRQAVGKGGKYGAIKGVNYRSSKSLFFKEKTEYQTPKSFIYPILSSLRSLIEIDNESNKYNWKKDPFDFIDENGKDLVQILVNAHRELGNNPNATGKSKNLWHTLYMTSLMKSS